MNKADIKITIVVTIFNIEKYIEKCINSIQMQTHSNLEIILIDDGSDDRSSSICDNFAANDRRITVIHKNNEGAALARKTGIDIASGKYLMFVDGDDWIEVDTVSKCLETAIKDNSDCVFFSYIREYENRQLPNPLFLNNFCYNNDDAEVKIHRRIIGFDSDDLKFPERIDNLSSMCMKLYRTDVAKRGKIVSERIVGTSEDTLFNVYALDGCKTISYINECFYHYRKTNINSITTQFKQNLPEKWDVLYSLFEEYLNNTNKNDEYRSAFLNRIACGMIGLGLNEVNSNLSFYKKAHRLNCILKRPLYREAFHKLKIKSCPLKWKIFFILCKLRLKFLLTFLLMIINRLRSQI